MTTRIPHPVTGWLLLILGGLALLMLASAYLFVNSLFGASSTPTKNANNATNGTIGDSFVTVVPSGVPSGHPTPLPTDPQRGSREPKVVLIEFGDFQCEQCALMRPIIEQILAAYPRDVKHVWKDFPLPLTHPQAEEAALAARCAAEQDAFWPYHDALLEQQDQFAVQPWSAIAQNLQLESASFSECLDTAQTRVLVLQGYYIARTYGLEEAPTYFVNDQILRGPQTFDTLKAAIEQELAKNP